MRKQGVDSEAERADGTLKERYFQVYFDPIRGEISTEKNLMLKYYLLTTKEIKGYGVEIKMELRIFLILEI